MVGFVDISLICLATSKIPFVVGVHFLSGALQPILLLSVSALDSVGGTSALDSVGGISRARCLFLNGFSLHDHSILFVKYCCVKNSNETHEDTCSCRVLSWRLEQNCLQGIQHEYYWHSNNLRCTARMLCDTRRSPAGTCTRQRNVRHVV